jgi:hypothetical protein
LVYLLKKRPPIAMRTLYIGGGVLLSLFIAHIFYFGQDPRLLMPGIFVILALAAYGAVTANRTFTSGFMRAGVLVLDLCLAGAVAVETASRLAMAAPESKLLAEIHALGPQVKNSVLVTDISIQWLELLEGGDRIEFIGMDNLFAEEAINEYHLHFLSERNSLEHPLPIPPILLPEGKLDSRVAQKLADQDKQGRAVYLLVAMPMRRAWATTLMSEFGELDHDFTLDPVQRYPEIALYRMNPR